MVSDAVLLRRYAETRDAEAFSELARRYAGMVYNTCLRLTGNPADAEDAAQESFLELARNAGKIHSSLPSWLHTVARSRAINAIRKESSRRRYEQQTLVVSEEQPEPTWAEIAPLVDEALESLPDTLRTPLILYYLEGHNQKELASELRISQATVSRQLDRGVALLRERLKDLGVVASVIVLTALLSENASTAVPPALAASLGKMALAGVGASRHTAGSAGAASVKIMVAGVLGTMFGKALLVTGVVGLVVLGWVLMRPQPKPVYIGTDNDCKQQLRQIRTELRDYYNKRSRLPEEMYDPMTTIGVPNKYKCPVDKSKTGHRALYIYNPKKYPDRWVMCITPGHENY